MAGLGGPLSMPLGGGPAPIEVEFDALLRALAKTADPEDPSNQAQAWAEAQILANIWAVNERIEGNMNPLRMMETLSTWEAASGIRPLPSDNEQERRAAIHARFLGLLGNETWRLFDTIRAIAGAAFVGFAYDPDPTSYMPGINPGPPGCEWASSKVVWGVKLVLTFLSSAQYADMERRIRAELELLSPGWDRFVIGTFESGLVPDVGIPDVTLL
jgi:hypothetical protein